MDWATFWGATTAAATVATAISTTVVLWLRRRTRPEADWVVVGSATRPDKEYGNASVWQVNLRLSLMNVGDGAAYRVMLRGVKADVGWGEKGPVIPMIAAGETVAAFGGLMDINDWDDARMVIEWTAPPTRLRKQETRTLALNEVVTNDPREQPAPKPARPDTPR